MNPIRNLLVDGDLVDVYRANQVRGGWTVLLIGTDGTPWGSHNVPSTWWKDRQAPGIRVNGSVYRHTDPEVIS